MLIDAFRLLLFPALVAFAASSDLITMTISNKVSLALLGGFVAMAAASGTSMGEFGWHLAAGATVLVIAFGCFASGWIGGGDAKLAAAVALWLGFEHLASYLIIASMIGGALTLLMLQFRTMPLPALLHGHLWAERLHDKNVGIPYGIALAAGALLVYPDTDWMRALGT